MGDAVTDQQTRVLLLNGQPIILQGDTPITEINAELLEQALQEVAAVEEAGEHHVEPLPRSVSAQQVTSSTTTSGAMQMQHPHQSAMHPMHPEHDVNNFVAIFENEHGETQTVQLSMEQAEALGFQVTAQAVTEPKKQQTMEAHRVAPMHSNLPEPPNIVGTAVTTAPSLVSMPVSFVPQMVGNSMTTYSVKLDENIPNITLPMHASETLATSSPSKHVISGSPSMNTGDQIAVRLKSSNPTSSAILRPAAATKTTIPRIQGTPTSMASLTMTPALPITSSTSMVRVTSSNQSPSKTEGVPVVPANASKPLGSSENPIQLVQHGQTFHSMQPLSQEQLKQIATVLQQKQLDTSRNSKNVLYDAQTNTRIIYRVVYPEDLALKNPSSGGSVTVPVSAGGGKGGRGTGRKGRPPKSAAKLVAPKKGSSDQEEEVVAAENDLSKGEREERKKVLPRTRSGRLSRPPRHMVKDYKRIHHLDFAEPDLDDSDGGYSDYRISDEEQTANPESLLPEDLEETAKAANASRRRAHAKFRCPTCKKMYLGYRRLGRHFEAYPDHGSMDNIPGPAQSSKGDENGGTPVVRPGIGAVLMKGIKRRGSHLVVSPSEKAARRKAKIKDFLLSQDPVEVAEVAGPLVARSLDAWALLRMRAQALRLGTPNSQLSSLVCELQTLLSTARSRVAEVLGTQGSSGNTEGNVCHSVEIMDPAVNAALNVARGVYKVLDSDDKRLDWRSSTDDNFPPASALDSQSLPCPISSQHSNTLEPAAKKARLWEEESPNDKGFLDTTTESEKPSDTSMCSDTPIDEIVHAELKKTGIEDFAAPPPAPSGQLQTGFVPGATVSSQFPADLVIDELPATQVQVHGNQSDVGDKNNSSIHFQLNPGQTRLDLSNSGMENLALSSAHSIDFEALEVEFHTNNHR